MAPSTENAAEAAALESASPSGRLRWFILAITAFLLALLLGSGILAIRFLRELHDEQQNVTHALVARTQTLSGLWLSVQAYNDAVRRYVAEAKADRDQMARRHLDQLLLEIDSELKSYPLNRDSTESALLAGIEGVVSQQRTLYVSILDGRPNESREAQSLISKRTAALQKQILDWSGKLEAWNGERLKDADRAMVAKFGILQEDLTRALAIGLGSGLLLMLASMVMIVRLERQTRQRYADLARNRRELQRLSSRLLDSQESERRSISRELHDEIGQSLGALLMDIGRLSTMLSNDRPELKPHLDNMKSVAERTVRSVRDIALLLRPSMLDDLGLIPALEWQGREVSRRSEIEVSVESENVPDDLPDEYRVCIYRLVQEALNNAVRHSGARNAKVSVGRDSNGIVVRVSDDGHGFDPGRARGLGILGMEERVKRLAGSLTVYSKPGQGVTLTATLPYPSRNTDAA
jgi:signal transduction histidine kinase